MNSKFTILSLWPGTDQGF